MIKKILIANRGEIAKRIIETCNRLDIETVGIYAQDDAKLAHAEEADFSVNLGRGTLAQTYLNQDKIIKIAKENNCDAIHPGYGFLSENTDFCKKIKENNLIFIGPSVAAIELMGDKKTSKIKMEALGIPVVPGYHGEDQTEGILKEKAEGIGYPVLIKATAGGGGKGMRIVRESNEFSDALAASKREAMNAFSNDKVLLEKYIEKPRHIEVQLVSDGKGNHFHFFERECSIQRRYQKVIEETPSVALDESLREEMCATAVKIAEGIDYQGAGTIEFILDQDGAFYFLEMNTRLQVEHPVTEMVTGFDLVELQIEAANGEAFDFKQEDIEQMGHAIECRIYAEDPDNEFLPTTGRIQKIEVDASTDYRLDCGYYDGSSISTNYDPMLAKLIVYGEDREEAIEQMQIALNSVVFGGTKTNRDYLKRLLNHDKFLAGDIHTHFIEDEKVGLAFEDPSEEELAVVFACALQSELTSIMNSAWVNRFTPTDKTIIVAGEEYSVSLLLRTPAGINFSYNGKKYKFACMYQDLNHLVMERNGDAFTAHQFILGPDGTRQLFVGHFETDYLVKGKVQGSTSSQVLGAGSLQSPMPGKIFKVLCQKGDTVKKGDPILIVEAMKMEHSIKSTKDGVIKDIFFSEGEQIQGGVLLCDIE